MPHNFTETKIPTKSGDRPQIVRDFLAQHYEIRVNVFDTSKIFIVPRDKKRYKQEPTLNDISLHMDSEGLRGCDGTLKKILSSPNQISTFNPVTDYFNGLKGKWQGESHIDLFCKHIIARDFHDREDGFYQERFKSLFRKWLAASVACSLGEYANDVMIGFVHANEGIGKTLALEFLIPKELEVYYTKSNKDPKYFDITKAFTTKFLINFDEMVWITKNNSEEFKQIMTSTTFSVNNTFAGTVPRIANAVFTSNKTREMGGFLYPQMGNRRFAVIELESINWKEYTKCIDIDQLWAEAYELYTMEEFDYVWNEANTAEFTEYNAKYMVETDAARLIKEYYRVPETDEECIYKQPIEILRDLRGARKLNSSMTNVSDNTIGMALKQLGFQKISKKIDRHSARYVYKMVQLF